MAASTITVKLSPKEYADLRRFLDELRHAKVSKAKRPAPAEVQPATPQERHALNQDVLSLNNLIDHI